MTRLIQTCAAISLAIFWGLAAFAATTDTVEPQQCTAFTPEFSCDTETGTTVVALTNTLAGQFDPTDISITSQTPGITLLQSRPNALVYGLQGAEAGQTITLWAEAVAKGAAGLDKCCMGEISLQVPQDFTCEKPVVLDVSKTCAPADGPMLMQQCTIDVHYQGPPPSPALTLTDTLTGTGANLMGPPSSTDNWSCTGTTTATCTIDAAADPTIDWANFDSTIQFDVGYQDGFENCAKVTGGGAEDEACASTSEPHLTITKTADQPICAAGQPCDFTITVTNPSQTDFNGPITLSDVVTTGQGGQFTAITPPLCDPANIDSCSGTANIPAGGSQSYVVTWIPPADPNGQEYNATNCAGVSFAGGVAGHQPGQSNSTDDGFCATVAVQPPSISITKTGPATCAKGETCTYDVTLTTGAAPYAGPVMLYDKAPDGFNVVSVTPAPAGCGGNLPAQRFVCVMQANLPANSSLTYQFAIQAETGDSKASQNCAGILAVSPDAALGDYSFDDMISPALDMIVDQGTPLGQSCVPVSLPVHDPLPPICGNGIVETGEICDDGNSDPNDACSNQCTAVVAGDLAIDKTCAPAVAGPMGLDIACTITINTSGSWPAGGINVTELLAQNLSPNDTGAAITNLTWPDVSANLNYAPLAPATPLTIGGFPSVLPASGSTVLNATVHLRNEGFLYEANNCATVQALDANGQNLDAPITDCETFTPPATARVAQTGPALTIQKTPMGPCTADPETRSKSCEFKITVTNTGAPYQGPIVLSDAFKGKVSDVTFSGGLDCRRAGEGAICLTGDTSIATGGEIFIILKTTHPDDAAPSFENCASLGAGSDPKSQAMVVQTALKLLGKYQGGIDGQVGRKTRAAIADLQKALGLDPTGQIDQSLIDALGVPSGGPAACVTVALPDLPRPLCNPDTTIAKDGECLCKYKNMYQKDETSCACVQGTKFIPGKGCLKPQISTPRPQGPKCDPATTRAKGGKCTCLSNDLLPISPTQCAPKNKVKHDCPQGQTFIKGLGCVDNDIYFGDSSKPPKEPMMP